MSKYPKKQSVLATIQKLRQRVENLERRVNTDHAVVISDKKIYLDGDTGDVYLMWNSTGSQLEFYVGGTLVGYLDATNTGTQLQNV